MAEEKAEYSESLKTRTVSSRYARETTLLKLLKQEPE